MLAIYPLYIPLDVSSPQKEQQTATELDYTVFAVGGCITGSINVGGSGALDRHKETHGPKRVAYKAQLKRHYGMGFIKF